MLSYRPEADEYVKLNCQHTGVFYRLSNGAGYRPGCMIFRIHHAEIFPDLEAYGGRISLSPAGSILVGLGCYRNRIHLSKEQSPKTPQAVEEMRHIPYASAVGSLMYAMLCTRPDIYLQWE